MWQSEVLGEQHACKDIVQRRLTDMLQQRIIFAVGICMLVKAGKTGKPLLQSQQDGGCHCSCRCKRCGEGAWHDLNRHHKALYVQMLAACLLLDLSALVC